MIKRNKETEKMADNKDKNTEKKAGEEKNMTEEKTKETKKEEKQKGKTSQEKDDESSKDKELEQLREKFQEINDKYLRLYSEFDNFRKRSVKEKLELRKTAAADIVTSLLPIIDDFERAEKSIQEDKESDATKEGIKLIFNKLKSVLNQNGVEEMKTIGEKFDPDLHEAITKIPADSDDKKGTIVDETQKGYMMNGKVIRFPKVVVAN